MRYLIAAVMLMGCGSNGDGAGDAGSVCTFHDPPMTCEGRGVPSPGQTMNGEWLVEFPWFGDCTADGCYLHSDGGVSACPPSLSLRVCIREDGTALVGTSDPSCGERSANITGRGDSIALGDVEIPDCQGSTIRLCGLQFGETSGKTWAEGCDGLCAALYWQRSGSAGTHVSADCPSFN